LLFQISTSPGVDCTISDQAPNLPSRLRFLITFAAKAASPTTGIAPITEVK